MAARKQNTHRQKPHPQERLTDLYTALMITLLVFIVPSSGYLGLTKAKWNVFLLLAGGYVGLCVFLTLAELVIGDRKGRELADAVRHSSWMQRLMLAYFALTCVSALLSSFGSSVWIGGSRRECVLTIGLYVFSFLMVSFFGRPKPWMAYLLAVTVTAQAILCILQLHGGNPFSIYPPGVNYFDHEKAYSGAYLGTVGNVDFLGAYFSLAVPILWAALLRMTSRRRFVFAVPLVLSAYVVLRMWVLSCVVGLLFGGMIALPIVLPAQKRTRVRVGLGLAGAAAAAVILLFFLDVGDGALHTLHALLHGEVARSLDSGRIYIWREVLHRVPRHLWFGTGPDTLSQAGIAPFRRYDENLGMMLVSKIDAAHCEYLNVLYNQGVFALCAYLGALFAGAAAWIRSANQRPSAAILGAAALCYAIQATFNISVFFSASLFWLTLGLLDSSCKSKSI